MPSRNKATRPGAVDGGDRPVDVVGEPVPCRDAKHRVWQALDLLQSYRLKRPEASGSTRLAVPVPAASGPAVRRHIR